MIYLWIIFGILALYFFYKNGYKPIQYWKERGVAYMPATPFLGTMGTNLFTRKYNMAEVFVKMYNSIPNAKYIGVFQFNNPALMIRDPEIIKQVTVKDFDSFMNHKVVLTEENEPLFGKNLLSLKGQKWKDMRSTLSPAFTSSKMRIMFQLITDCAEQFVKYFENKTKETGIAEIEMKDIFTRYTNDVIATAAFGIQCDSLTHQENEFYMIGKKSTTFSATALIKMLGYIACPRLMKMLGIKVMDQKVTNYFSDIILSTLRLREKENVIRPDMIHLLMEARKGRLKHETNEIENDTSFSAVEESSANKPKSDNENKLTLSDDDIIAQAFLFFFAGYDTGSTMMSFMAYELAINPDTQKKLQEEIDDVVAKNKLDYESILKMKYLDMVVSESLRKWPPGPLTERLCEKPYLLSTNDNEKPLLIEKDISIWIPVYAIHHDPAYYPDPERFDPERFSDENKENIQPFTYLPFGAGPRNCIGSRFALLEIKTLFVHFLSKFDLTVIEKTQIPLKLNKKTFNFQTEKGIWLGIKPRQK